MKFIRKIALSRMCLPVCGVLSVLALVYIGFAVRNMVTDTPLSQRAFVLLEARNEEEISLPQQSDEQQEIEILEWETEIFTAREEINLPEAPMPEDSPAEQQTATRPEIETKPPATTQKPAESVTTKPPRTTRPETQKPAQTTKPQDQPAKPPQTTPVTAWNVTLKQAKSMVKSDSAYDYEDLYWLSRIISAEAKGESFTGQIGVGTVVLNRVRSKEFPNTIKGVVFDRKYGTQFTPVANGSIYDKPTESAVVAAKMCLDGYTLSNSVLYFVNPRIATSSWIQNNRTYAFRVGNHDFYN